MTRVFKGERQQLAAQGIAWHYSFQRPNRATRMPEAVSCASSTHRKGDGDVCAHAVRGLARSAISVGTLGSRTPLMLFPCGSHSMCDGLRFGRAPPRPPHSNDLLVLPCA